MNLFDDIGELLRPFFGSCASLDHPVAGFTAEKITQVVADECTAGTTQNHERNRQVTRASGNTANYDQCFARHDWQHRVERRDHKNHQIKPRRRRRLFQPLKKRINYRQHATMLDDVGFFVSFQTAKIWQMFDDDETDECQSRGNLPGFGAFVIDAERQRNRNRQ